MPIQDTNRVFDGWLNLEGGVDAGRAPSSIETNQCVSATNMTFRGGNPSTRPGFRKIDESFPEFFSQRWCYRLPFSGHLVGEYAAVNAVPSPIPSYFTNENSEYIYRNGIVQCAIPFSPHYGQDCIMAMIGGRIFQIIPSKSTASVREIIPDELPTLTGAGGTPKKSFRNRKDLPIAYMVQADKWLVIQDGNSRAILFDGAVARRAITATTADKTEVPVGTIMAYGMGRLCVVVNKRDVAFGDLYGSHDLTDPGDSIPFFTERNFLAGGFDAAIPFQQGIATGMSFFPQLDTSTGNGQLLVFAEKGAASFFLSLPRDQWQTSQFQIVALLTTNMRGHRSLSVVNEDLWFRADDGQRSYRQARSEPTGWAHIPLSTNVRQYFDNDSQTLLKYASSCYFDNRILTTVSPLWNQGRPVHEGVVVVDFDILSSFGVNNRPAWEGNWTLPGQRISQVLSGAFNGVTRAFVFAVDSEGINQLYELSLDDITDWDNQAIEWSMENRAFDFQKLSQQSSPYNEVELYDADFWLRNANGLESFAVSYRPDSYPYWVPWKEFPLGLPMIGLPGELGVGGIPTIKEGFYPRLSIGKPDNSTDTDTTRRRLRRGYEFQLKFEGRGHVVIDRFRLHAQKETEKSRGIT